MRARSILPALTLLLTSALLLSSCSGFTGQPSPTGVSDLEYTQAAETITAALTQNALPPAVTEEMVEEASNPTSSPTSPPEPTETLPPTSTPLPTKTPRPTDVPQPTNTPTPDFSPTPTFTPEPAWNLVYQDDLKSGSWITEKTNSYRLQYSMGGYMISSDVENDIVFSVRKGEFTNVRVDVTGMRVSGPTDSYYGVICHFANGGNYYLLGIGVDGWYGIALKQAGQIRFLKEGMDTSGTVRMAGAENQIRAECGAGKLTLWVNGVQMASVDDQTFTGGAIGLGVGNRKTAGAEIVFKDFMVYEPVEP